MSTKKFVFEEVHHSDQRHESQSTKNETSIILSNAKATVIWLLLLLGLIICMICVGGITRLTDSGLSIVEWKPLMGAIPPLSDKVWIIEFEKYKTIPEFILTKSDMSMNEFKFIYFWEWSHRQLGRVIGLVWFVGFLSIFVLKKVPSGWSLKLFSIGALIGMQGFIGWWMVYSGLHGDMTDVASYRLAIHLGVAFCILGLIFWSILSLRETNESLVVNRRYRDKRLNILLNLFLIALFFQIILGALVAGIHAGSSYNDWPLMDGKMFPSNYIMYDRFWVNFFENPAFVQFNHRLSAYVLTVLGTMIWILSTKNPIKFIRRCHLFLIFILFSQVFLGVITLIYGAIFQLAILHQLLGVILWLSAIWVKFETAYPRRQAII